MRRVPEALNLSILAFLQHGDKEKIAAEDRKAGYKTHKNYVCAVCAGRHRNDRILNKAFRLAISRMQQFPKQVLSINQ